jgi:hypothetical protein
MENPLWVNDVVTQNSLKVNDVMAHLGKRCLGTYQLSVIGYRLLCIRHQFLRLPTNTYRHDESYPYNILLFVPLFNQITPYEKQEQINYYFILHSHSSFLC